MTRGTSTAIPRAFRVFAATLLLTCILLGASAARACDPQVTAWVAEARIGAGIPIETVACAPGRARLRLSPKPAAGDTGEPRADPGSLDLAPLDVEVAEPPGPAFRRVGRLRVSPIVEIRDYSMLPAAQREAFERLVGWLAAHEARVALAGSDDPRPIAPLGGVGIRDVGAWIVAGALALALLALGSTRSPASSRPGGQREARLGALTAAGLGALGLALRLGLGVWGPHHINGQGPLWIGGATDPSRLSSYGPGYAELFGALARAAPGSPDWAIFAANAALAALAAPLGFALASALGLGRARATLAGALLAVDPVSIRFGATESYFSSIVALTLGGALLYALGAAAAARRAHLRAVMLAAAGALLCAQAARVHPTAWVPVALAPLVALIPAGPAGPAAASKGGWAEWRGRLARASLAAGLGAGVVLVTGGSWIAALASAIPTDRSGIGASLDLTDTVAVLLLAAPCALSPRLRPAVVVAALHAVAMVNTRRIYGQSDLWQASFDRLYLTIPVIVGLGLLPEVWSRRVVASRLAPVTLGGLLLLGLPTILRRTTEQHEYAWLRAQLRAITPGCRVAHVGRAGPRVLYVPEYVAPPLPGRRHLDGATSNDVLAALGETPCIHYVRTSLCSSPEGRRACEAVESGLTLEPGARASFAAAPSYDALGYEGDEVEVVVSRVLGGLRSRGR